MGVTVESIIVDLFVHDTDVAQGREGSRAVRGRGKGEYLEKCTWLL